MKQLHQEKEKLQKKMYDYLKSKALDYEGEVSDELIEYRQNITELSARNFEVVGMNNLLSRIEDSQIVYLGDFHTFDQSPRNLKRILKILIAKEKKITLALELVHISHQQYIDSYLEGHITEMEFLEEINYHESWRFPWKHYSVLFEEAKNGNVEIIGLNSQGSLSQRDDKAAHVICNYKKENPEHIVVVLFGEYHIAHNKLPRRVDEILDVPSVKTIIYQNIDEIFWKLDTEIREETQVITFENDEFSIQSSPPWIKYESMIYWFENLCDDPDFDFHESALESQANDFNDNVYDNFTYICEELNNQFNFQIEEDEIHNFNLYDYHSIEFVLEETEENDSGKEVKAFISTLMEKGKSFKIFNRNDYYCSSYSINRLAFLAGIHLFSQNKRFVLSEEVVNQGNKTAIFNFFTLRNLFGYYCSKIINPYRKCDLYLDFKDKSNISGKDQDFNKKLLDICDYISMNKSIDHYLEDEPHYGLYILSRSIGYMMGDVLYDIHHDSPDASPFDDIFTKFMEGKSELKSFDDLFNAIIPAETLRSLRKSYF